jgi:dTDP-glucose pyrophosphorylase
MDTAKRTGDAMVLGIMEVPPDVSLEARSVVILDGSNVLDIIEKPGPNERTSNFTSLPLYILGQEIFSELAKLPLSKRGEYELPGAIRNLIASGCSAVSSLVRERDDVTALPDLLALNMKVLRTLSPSVQIARDVFIPPTVSLVGPVFIESGVSIGEGASLGPLVYLESGSIVDPRVRVERTVVTRDSRVSRDIQDEIVVSSR